MSTERIEINRDNLPISVSEQERISGVVCNAVEGADLPIFGADTYALAAQRRKHVKDVVKELDELRKTYTRPLDEMKRRIMDFFRKPEELLSKADKQLAQSIIAYDAEQRRKREQEQRELETALKAKRQADAEAAALKALKTGKKELAAKILDTAEREPVAVPVLPEAKPLPGTGVSYRSEWRFLVTDPEQVPRQFLCVDEPVLRAFVKADKGRSVIPGVKVFEDKIPIQR